MSTKPEFTGKNVNYYLVDVKQPKRLTPYQAECEDIIEALGMTFAEGCAFKAIWRSCAARTLGLAKKGQDAHGVYDAEKVEYYGARMVAARTRLKETQAARQTDNAINFFITSGAPNLIDPVKVCPRVFRDIGCKYKKEYPTSCEKSIDFCNSIGNSENFGGMP